jgi:uncharacterized protein (DUF1778 family)
MADKIEGVPDGWELVKIVNPTGGDWYIDGDGRYVIDRLRMRKNSGRIGIGGLREKLVSIQALSMVLGESRVTTMMAYGGLTNGNRPTRKSLIPVDASTMEPPLESRLLSSTVSVTTTQPADWAALIRRAASVEGIELSAFYGFAAVDRAIRVLAIDPNKAWAKLSERKRGRPVYDVEQAPRVKRKRGRKDA